MEKFNKLLKCEFRFAKTYLTAPHFYIVRDNLPYDYKRLYDEFWEYIDKNWYTKYFYNTPYRYIEIDWYKYRMMENILNRTPLSKEKLKEDIKNLWLSEKDKITVLNSFKW